MAQPNKPAKTMSSRLATMKFMQRGAATPSSSPGTPPEPASKRQRLINGSYQSTPSSTPHSNSQVIDDALAAQDLKRNELLEQEAESRGDSKWYLSFKEPQIRSNTALLRIVSAGYSTLDGTSVDVDRSISDDDETSRTPQLPGRRSFGKFNRKIEKQQNPDVSSAESSSESDSSDHEDGDADDSDDPTGAKAMITQARKEAGDKARAERKAKRKADKAEALRLAEERRNKQVKLNKLKSISGGGGGTGGGIGATPTRSSSVKDSHCYKCGKKGHLKRDCPLLAQ